MASLLVRNYSFFIAAAVFSSAAACSAVSATPSFQSLAHFISTNTKPSGTIGDTQKTMTISATSFRGYNRFSPLLICFGLANITRTLMSIFELYDIYVLHSLPQLTGAHCPQPALHVRLLSNPRVTVPPPG